MFEFNATFLVAMLSFVIFIMIMNTIFYKPVLNIIRKREEYIKTNYDNAKDNTIQAQTFDTERDKELQKTQDICRENIKDIVETAHNEANEKTHIARLQAKKEIQSRKYALYKEEESLENAVKSSVVNDIASSITSKLLGKNYAGTKATD